jgi:oligopeptide/dipeptide ABC transporter ATP-binding protein
VVEYCDVRPAFRSTRHPYTAGCWRRCRSWVPETERLRVIPGNVPNPANFPSGCRFHPRCPIAVERCRTEMPALRDVGGGHLARCFRAEEIASGAVDPVAGEGANRG